MQEVNTLITQDLLLINVCLYIKQQTAYLKNSLSYSGVLLWNSIPPHIRNCTTIDSFKRMFLSE